MDEDLREIVSEAIRAEIAAREEATKRRLEDEIEAVIHGVQTAIRAKVLESFRNGQATGPTKRYFGKQKQTQK